MRIKSFGRGELGLKELTVEISMMPGLPSLRFLGWPDHLIKESEWRLKAAFRSQGFVWPKAQQIIIQLHPSYEKKSSRGLDLAIALGIIWMTGQAQPPENKYAVYGELDLRGYVTAPDDIECIWNLVPSEVLWTGAVDKELECDSHQLLCLRDISNPSYVSASRKACLKGAGRQQDIFLCENESVVYQVAILGEHSLLLAGPPGSGKSTMAESIAQNIGEINDDLSREVRSIAHFFGDDSHFRPIRRPHHSSTALSLIGGGRPLRPGEITKAHGGALILDEWLEFSTVVQESLREPLETGYISVSRVGESATWPAQILLLATTNLCPCGRFTPQNPSHCRCTGLKLRRYLEKISGPMLDRFHIVHVVHNSHSEKRTKSLFELNKKIKEAQEWVSQLRTSKVPNSRWSLVEIKETVRSEVWGYMPKHAESIRRNEAMIRVARTLADLDFSERVQLQHMETARQLTQESMVQLLKS